jgi:DNA-binding transcriptional LysR family regulator
MNITSRQLKAFLLTARHQSFSRAAEQLFITQSGMSVLIRELEDQLGFRLFDRTTRRVKLTEFGVKFLPIADRSVVDLELAAANIGRSASAASQRVRFGATPLIAGKLLPAVIGQYSKRVPSMELLLHDGDRSRLVSLVTSGELDVALGCFLQPVSGVRRIPIYRFSLIAVQPEAEARRLHRPFGWDDLVGARLLGGPPDDLIQQLIDRELQRLGRRDPPEMVLNYFETQIAMAEAGAGIAIIPSYCIPACRTHRVAMHMLTDPVVPIDLFEIIDRGRKLPAGIEEFNEFLRAYIADWAEPTTFPNVAQAA